MRRALTDASGLYDHVAAQDPKVALAMETAIRHACSGLAQSAYANPSTSRPNIFRLPIRKYGITVFYRVRPRLAKVEVLRIVRGKRVRSLGRVPR
jgi:plasmid stabilization system protein ParE